ncbi:MAG TPA: tRNA (N6-threonylcarbamoyladenosine(37)-N6)-methyltransferase TrmO [Bdellovibrionota bacterium]|jgi:tRNA-Thr(GGU) m(6)t(6)A37 methyltransferase TsaA|nr:tRNA (N6-threonylcarbamoyladenosine(37)-N6)-methyltransferase TrmO [Bdellovibrionota bacterium]
MNVKPLGFLKADFGNRFGIPRQSGLVPAARAELEFKGQAVASVEGIEEFSHLWVIFEFHLSKGKSATRETTARPPRLGGRKRVGVLATRSPFRPNPIGLSLVTLQEVRRSRGRVVLVLGGGDFVDGTPVLDIKPYLPWADEAPGARAGWASEPPPRVRVRWSPEAESQGQARLRGGYAKFKELVDQTLSLDHRPPDVAKRGGGKFASPLAGIDVHWVYEDGDCVVTCLKDPRS